MKKSTIEAFLLLALLLFFAPASHSDPVPLLAGKSLQALKKTDVRIAREDLAIDLSLDQMNVRAAFLFNNPGGRTVFPVGFPCEPDRAGMAGMNCRFPLNVTVRGKAVAAEIKSVAEYGRCWVWDMRLEANEQVRLELSYSAAIVNERYDVPLAGVWFVYYPLHTGSNWSGPIGNLNISVSLPVETVVQIGPPGYARSPGMVEWHLSNYRPLDDLFIILDPQLTSRYIGEGFAKGKGRDPDGKKRQEFADFFLKGMPLVLRSYQSMADIFRRFNFPPQRGIERVVRESCEILRTSSRTR